MCGCPFEARGEPCRGTGFREALLPKRWTAVLLTPSATMGAVDLDAAANPERSGEGRVDVCRVVKRRCSGVSIPHNPTCKRFLSARQTRLAWLAATGQLATSDDERSLDEQKRAETDNACEAQSRQRINRVKFTL